MEGERLDLRRRPDWSLLPRELFDLIVERLGPSDLFQVRCVCSSWRSISPRSPLWLILPCHNIIIVDEDENLNERSRNGESNSNSDPEQGLGFLGFVNLSNPSRRIHKLQIPEANGSTILASSAGWLVALRANGAIRLLHLFSRTKIQLPPLRLARVGAFMGKISKMSIEKVIVGSGSDGKPLVICKYAGKLALYRPKKDLNWVPFKHYRGVIEDSVSYNGRLYGVRISRNKCLVCVACGLDGPSPAMEELMEIPKYSGYIQYYLVESLGYLLMVLRHINWPTNCKTNNFTVFRLDISGMVVELNDLTEALFLDDNSAVSVSAFASDFAAFKGNRIYFISACFPNHNWAGKCEMKVFNLENETIESFDYCDDPKLIMHAPIFFPTNPCGRARCVGVQDGIV